MRHMRFAVLVPLLLNACAEKPQTLVAPDDLALQMIWSNMSPWTEATEWTEATDAPFVGVNTSDATEGCPFVTRSEHVLVFASSRADGQGALDLYISYWDAAAKQWGTPANLGPNINTVANEQCPLLSQDGKELIFVSNRGGAAWGLDLWVAHRHDNRSDLEWEPAVNLATVNSTADEFGPGWYEENGRTVLYFNSNRDGGVQKQHDLYVSHQTPVGTFAAPVPAAELNTSFQEQFPTLSKDGLEIFFSSNRPGTLGGSDGPLALDLWHATRERTADLWGTPANLGPAVNSEFAEGRSAISWDGMTLYFHSNRKGSVDLFQTTRTP